MGVSYRQLDKANIYGGKYIMENKLNLLLSNPVL